MDDHLSKSNDLIDGGNKSDLQLNEDDLKEGLQMEVNEQIEIKNVDYSKYIIYDQSHQTDKNKTPIKQQSNQTFAKFYSPSPVSKLAHTKKQHKEINNLIHVYTHKVLYNISPIKRTVTNSHNSQSLPTIEKRKLLDTSKSEGIRNLIKINGAITTSQPKFSLEEEKARLQKMKEMIKLNKEKKQKEAKNLKDANRLMRENIIIFKEKLKEENKQKKRIVDAKYLILKNSIENYKILKKECIDNAFNEEVDKEIKQILKKQNQLELLKSEHEKEKGAEGNSSKFLKSSRSFISGKKNNPKINGDLKFLHPI